MKHSYLVWIGISIALIGCSEKKQFTAGANAAGTESQADAREATPSPAVDTGSSGGAAAKACIKETTDKILVPWQGPIKDCFDRGKIYNFEKQSCMEIAKASFACDWSTLLAKLAEKGLSSNALNTDSASGAKLISCAQSADGNRIAVQWVKVQEQQLDCQTLKTGTGVTTGCYQYFVDSVPPPPPANAEEARQRVAECMKDL